jgi:hypothetical protein
MTEKGNQKKQNSATEKKENCPLCRVSEETIEILKKTGRSNKEGRDKGGQH